MTDAELAALIARLNGWVAAGKEYSMPKLDGEPLDKLAAEAAAALAAQAQKVAGYQGSRDYAIDLLSGALRIDADKALEYYARLAAERIAAQAQRIEELERIADTLREFKPIAERAIARAEKAEAVIAGFIIQPKEQQR